MKKKQQTRAESLRRQIGQLKERGTKPPPSPAAETPAEFIHRRMAELEAEERKKKSKG